MAEVNNRPTDSVTIQTDKKPVLVDDGHHNHGAGEEAVEAVKKLGFLDKYLSLWILLACGIGLGLGQAPAVIKVIEKTSVGPTNIFVAIGLIFMVFPPLAKVKWNTLQQVRRVEKTAR